MSIVNFLPEVWAPLLLASLKKALVYGMLVNRDYEGEISEFGDTVTITSISRPTISTYTPNSTAIVPETLTDAQRKLLVDQSKYFAFEVDDVDRRQARGDVMPESMREAAYGLGDVADQFIAALYTGVQTANDLGTIAVPTATPLVAYDSVLVPLKVELDESNVPDEDRWCVIPPWFHGRLLRDDRFIRADASGREAASIRGFIGEAAGFRLHVSNNTPAPGGDDNEVIAGYRGAISYAEQINKVEAYRPEDSFSDAVKGLHLYGAKLVRPDGIAVCRASQT
jgi:hypothetical protein